MSMPDMRAGGNIW